MYKLNMKSNLENQIFSENKAGNTAHSTNVITLKVNMATLQRKSWQYV